MELGVVSVWHLNALSKTKDEGKEFYKGQIWYLTLGAHVKDWVLLWNR